jgi:hypothetical protein
MSLDNVLANGRRGQRQPGGAGRRVGLFDRPDGGRSNAPRKAARAPSLGSLAGACDHPVRRCRDDLARCTRAGFGEADYDWSNAIKLLMMKASRQIGLTAQSRNDDAAFVRHDAE